jgi:conjugative transfer region protein (TIGR03750 family)
MLLHEINQTMPIYKDCTLSEILGVGAAVFLVLILVFSIITRILFGYASIGVVITFAGFFHTTKYFITKLQKCKYGKPYGYYQQYILKRLLESGLIKGVFMIRKGRWSVRREK